MVTNTRPSSWNPINTSVTSKHMLRLFRKPWPGGFCCLSIAVLALWLVQVPAAHANDACTGVPPFLLICSGDQSSGVQREGNYWVDNDPPVYNGPFSLIFLSQTNNIHPANGSAGISLVTGSQTGEVGGILWDDGENGSYSPISSVEYTGGFYGITTGGDYASGIKVSNTGGTGGDGSAALDDSNAGNGGDGGVVTVLHHSGNISTMGAVSPAIFAYSSGGNGGTGGDSIFGEGGNSGSGGVGGAVSVTVEQGDLETYQDISSGIVAASVGGSAGDVGFCVGICVGEANVGTAQAGGTVQVTTGLSTSISTRGFRSYGILAQSKGGGGGDGGFGTLFGAATWSSDGGGGGDGGHVIVDSNGGITTRGDNARGIYAYSVGGGGGDGGDSIALLAALGGDGGVAGKGGDVDVTFGAEGYSVLGTFGDKAEGIYAQSVGGGGGDGGYAAGLVSIGGKGGAAGNGGNVTVTNYGVIQTGLGGGADDAHAIFAQSVGGGGGNGGFTFGDISLGGDGGVGGVGGEVTVTNTGVRLATSGNSAAGIYAQSVGSGGGTGGNSIAVGLPLFPVVLAVAVGGDGGKGGNRGEKVTVNSSGGNIETNGNDSAGIWAESIGGGGGDAGYAIGASVAPLASLTLAIGGNGETASDGGAVEVQNRSGITTNGASYSPGIAAQSVGGGGGNGGFSFAGGMSAANLQVSIGGKGNSGGNGGAVTVGSENTSNSGNIYTRGEFSSGIQALSQGSGGGTGGFSVAAGLSTIGSANFTLGGNGGTGGTGGEVNVYSNRNISTSGQDSYGIFADSRGGRGGVGGFSVAGALTSGQQLGISIGGGGGSGGTGGDVNVGSGLGSWITGTIKTSGENAAAIKALSAGGDGGSAGFSVAGAASLNGGLDFSLGRSGGSGNESGDVRVIKNAEIITTNVGAQGIFAQSLAGSGGDGGFTATGGLSHGNTINLTVGGGGGSGNTAGTVTVGSFGSINTQGAGAKGIQAVSQGGNGGNAGIAAAAQLSYAPGYQPGSTGGNINVVVGRGGGSSGQGELVTVTNWGEITTGGKNAQGIYAQSIGGDGGTGGYSRSEEHTSELQSLS